MKLSWKVKACLTALWLAAPVASAAESADPFRSAWDSPVSAVPAGYEYERMTISDDCGCSMSCDCDSQCVSDCGGNDPWSFSFTQTVGYGTGLALPITLTPANTGLVLGVFEDDFEFMTSTALNRVFTIDDVTTFTAGAGYYQNMHPDVDELDLQAPTVTAQLARQIGERTVAAIDYSYSYYFLSGSSFLSQHRLDLSTLRRVNDRWDWKATGGYSNADFRLFPFLDSDNYSTRGELIRYLDNERRDYITFGAGYGVSNALEDSFSYDVRSVFIGGRFGLDSYDLYTLSITAVYGEYDFEEPDLFQPGVVRSDELFTGNTSISRYVSESLSTFVSYSYLNSESNLARQNYHTNLVSLGFTYVR